MKAPRSVAAQKLHVWRGDRHVLQAVSFELAQGQLLHICGPNGTGKTTLLRVMSGLLRPESGAVIWDGANIVAARAHYLAAMAYSAHEPALKADLTALENLHFSVGLKRRASKSELLDSLSRTGAESCADLPARVLSAGQKRRVALARVLAMRATLWLLDEPYANMDSAGAALLTQLLEAHLESGGLSLVVAHQQLTLRGDVRRLELKS